MSQITIARGPNCYNYYVLRNIFDEKVIEEARSVVSMLPSLGGVYSLSAANTVYAYMDKMPTLVDRLYENFADVHILGSNFFCSEPTPSDREELGDWHAGHSLYFGIEGGAPYTLWIPLQDVNEETGGRLKMYNGKYISQMDDLLDCQVKTTGNSISNKDSILKFLTNELNDNFTVPSLSVGDGLLFDEMLPHQAEKCHIQRNVLAVRLVLGDFTLNRELIQKVLTRYDTVPGEDSTAREFLENLLEFKEYKRPDPSKQEPLNIERDPMPVANMTKPTVLERAKRRLRRGAGG